MDLCVIYLFITLKKKKVDQEAMNVLTVLIF
jgi:hypothetical protein